MPWGAATFAIAIYSSPLEVTPVLPLWVFVDFRLRRGAPPNLVRCILASDFSARVLHIPGGLRDSGLTAPRGGRQPPQ